MSPLVWVKTFIGLNERILELKSRNKHLMLCLNFARRKMGSFLYIGAPNVVRHDIATWQIKIISCTKQDDIRGRGLKNKKKVTICTLFGSSLIFVRALCICGCVQQFFSVLSIKKIRDSQNQILPHGCCVCH